MSLAGCVIVKARVTGNCLSDIKVHSLRPNLAQKLVQGRPLSEATDRISQCYVVCQQAQTLAAYLAYKQKVPSSDQLVSIQLEAIDQTLWRWMVDLPKLVSLPTQLTEYAKIKQQIVNWQRRSFSSNRPVSEQVTANLEVVNQWFSELVGVSASQWAGYSIKQLERWIDSDSIAAHIIKISQDLIPVADSQQSIEPQHYTDQLSQLNRPAWVHKAIQRITQATAEEAEFFKQSGKIWSIPVIQLLKRLRDFANSVNGLVSNNVNVEYGFEARDDQILTWVMTARGWLLHNITLNNEKSVPNHVPISDYRILSPTDSYFCQNGQVEKFLQQLRFRNLTQVSTILELTILASDPCVEYKVEIEYA